MTKTKEKMLEELKEYRESAPQTPDEDARHLAEKWAESDDDTKASLLFDARNQVWEISGAQFQAKINKKDSGAGLYTTSILIDDSDLDILIAVKEQKSDIIVARSEGTFPGTISYIYPDPEHLGKTIVKIRTRLTRITSAGNN